MDTSTGKKHRRRFERETASRRLPLRLQPRDRDIIKLVYDHRFLTTPMIEQLLGDTGKSHRGMLLRLQKLFHNGYLDRTRLPDADNPPIVYALGNRGADILTLHFGIDRAKVDWTSKNREVTERYIHHGLMVSRFRLAVSLAMKSRQDASIHFWEPDGVVKDAVTCRNHETQQEQRIPIVPDAFFAIREKDKLHPLFLEADRSTMTDDRFVTKLRGYYEFWHQKLRGGKSYGVGGHEIQTFRVLTITISEERKENLRKIARDVDGKGSALFWFLCEKQYVANPAVLFTRVWQTPRDDSLRELLEQPRRRQQSVN